MSIATSDYSKFASSNIPNRSISVAKQRAQQVVGRARDALENHPHFHKRTDSIEIRFLHDRLLLTGTLPSFYLKQQAQEAIRSVGTFAIDNQIVVNGMIGEMIAEAQSGFSPASQGQSTIKPR